MSDNVQKWRKFQYYIIISFISLICIFFLPSLGSSAGIDLLYPTTTAGWIVYVSTKLILVVINITIYHCFILQAKINVKDNDKYKRANEILSELFANNANSNIYKPQSPKERHKDLYGRKALSLSVSTLLSSVCLTQAILVFDIIQMLSYLFTITIAIITGIIVMNDEEEYWISTYLDYAIMKQKEFEQQEGENNVNNN